jgi:SAM-dependent methyltransferase
MPAGSGDRWPDDYERGRPGWPHAVLDAVDLPAAATVLDLGAGTGKLTRLLAATYDRVVAVEPADAMRRLLVRLCPQAAAAAGHAREIPLADRSVDAVFAAEAYHWFDDERALAEIARVLREGGALILLWNLPAGPWEPSIASIEARFGERLPADGVDHDPLDLGGPRRGDGQWPALLATARFGPIQHTHTANPQTLDRDGLVCFLASMGWIADLADEERLPLLADVRSHLTSSEYRRQWTTHVYLTHLRPTPHHGLGPRRPE